MLRKCRTGLRPAAFVGVMGPSEKMPRFTWAEVLVALVALALLARFYWAREILQWEENTLGGYRFLVTIPLVCFGVYCCFRNQPALVRRRAVRLVGVGFFLLAAVIGFSYFGVNVG